MAHLGSRLAQLRKQKGMTQNQLANAIGRDSMTVSRWERGERIMRADDVAAVAEALGIHAGLLFEEPTEPTGDEAA